MLCINRYDYGPKHCWAWADRLEKRMTNLAGPTCIGVDSTMLDGWKLGFCKLSNHLLRPQNQWNEQPRCEKPSTVGWTSTVRFDCLLKVCPSLQDEDKWLPSLRLPSNKNMMHLWNLTVRTTYPTVSSVWAHEPWRAQEGDMFLEHLNLGALAASRGSWNPNQLVAHRPAWCKCEQQNMMNVEHRGSMWIFRMTSIAPVTRELPAPCWCIAGCVSELERMWRRWPVPLAQIPGLGQSCWAERDRLTADADQVKTRSNW